MGKNVQNGCALLETAAWLPGHDAVSFLISPNPHFVFYEPGTCSQLPLVARFQKVNVPRRCRIGLAAGIPLSLPAW